MTERRQILETVTRQIEPFNKKGVSLTEATSFQNDLEWDSLTVMDFVAAVEDEFDIVITMNMQAEIETVGQLVDAVGKLKARPRTACSKKRSWSLPRSRQRAI